MQFITQTKIIEAYRLINQTTIETRNGIITGNNGDWLIIDEQGEQTILPNDEFTDRYEPYYEEPEEEEKPRWWHRFRRKKEHKLTAADLLEDD